MRKRLASVLKTINQSELARSIGCNNSRISQLAKSNPGAWVYFDDNEKPSHIEYDVTRTVRLGGK